VDGEAVRSLIHAIFPSFRLICEPVHCLDETVLNCSINEAVFSRFHRLNAPITLYVILAVDGLALLEVIDEYNTTRIPEY
jgi:hypothetical protein